MRPVLKYPGAKWRLSPWIIENMPDHESYLEPYFGSGGVFFNKPKSRLETINDINGEIVNFFKVCRDRPEELSRVISLTPWARDELRSCKNTETDDEVKRARITAVTCFMTFGSRQVSNTWRYSSGAKKNGGPDNAKHWNNLPFIVCEVAERLKDAQIENKSAIELILKFNGPNVVIYLDPPYVKSTRTLHGDQYTHEMTNSDHEELLHTVSDHEAKIILSGYDNELYNDYLKDWRKIQKPTRIERGRIKTETLWLNFGEKD